MRKLIPVLLLLPFTLWIACGGDDDGGTNGPNGVQLKRVVANTSAPGPAMNSADEAVWNSVQSFVIPVASGGIPKAVPNYATSLPDSVLVQAIRTQDSLYIRLQWEDSSRNAFPNYFVVTNINEFGILPVVEFTDTAGTTEEEDQVFVLFSGLGDGGYDVWNWRALTTGSVGLGEDYILLDLNPDPDPNGTSTDEPAMQNPEESGFKRPIFIHKDTSEFSGDSLDPILCAADTIKLVDTVRWEPNPPDSIAVQAFNTEGWTVGQRVPGWIINCDFAGLTEQERGSRWEIRTASVYDDAQKQYRVVLARLLNTGDQTNDLNLAIIDSLEVSLGFFDNQWTFSTGGTKRIFSEKFWLVLQ